MKVIVPNAKVGSVIGKGGSVIRHIRETTKAQVSIASSIPGETDRVVTITGTQEATQQAFNLIQAKVSEEEGSGGAPGGGYGGGGAPQQDNSYLDVQPGELVVRQLIPAAQIGSLIGKGGTTIGGIRTQSGAKVKVSSTPEPGTTERMITIIGTLLQCQIAQQLISQKLLEEMGEGAAYGGAPQMGGYGAAAGQAAGYGQAVGYGADAYAQADPYAAAAYGQAANMMGQMQQQYGMMDPNAGMSAMGYGAPAPQAQSQVGMTTSEISLPDDAMGRVIGRAGSNINEIRSVSGAQIKVVPKDGISPMRRVTLTGTAEQIASATLMIQRMT